MPSFKQETFDARLRDILTDAVDEGKKSVRVKAGNLELMVVGKRDGTNQRAPMACNALQKEFNGDYGDVWTNGHPSRPSTTVEAEFRLPRPPKR